MEEPTEDPGGQEASGGVSGHQRERSPMLHLDLYNFECPEAEGSRYVLTSPRSLEACARCLVKPVELLARNLSDLVKEAPGRSMRVATGLCEVYEIERQRKLKMCREEREKIIRQEKRRILPMVISSSLGSPSTSKCPSRAEPIPAMDSKRYNSPTTSHQRKITPPSKDAHRTETPPSKSNSPLTKGSKKHHPPSSKDQKSDPSLFNNVPSCDSPASKEPVHAVPPKNKSQSLDSLQRMRDGASARTSSESATSSYSGDSARDKAAQFLQRPQTLETVNSLMGRSFSLGDLSHSPQTTKKVEKMVKEVKKMGVRELPQRDKKIAALMIARHQEENIRNEHRYWAHLQWDTQRKSSELRREQEDRERHRISVQGQRRWEYQVKKKSNITSLEEPSASSLTQSRSPAQLEKWKEQDQGKETVKRGKLEKAKEGGEQKKTQRKKEALEQEEGASQQKQFTDQNKKLEKKKAEKIKHQVLLQELYQKEESENEELKKTLENNLHRAQENIEHLLEKRNQDLKNKARKEGLQTLKARQAAERKERERRDHLEEQVRTAQRRLQHASQVAEEVAHHKARKALEGRLGKEKAQRENRERVQMKEDMKRQELLVSIEKKLERSEQIYKEKQTVLDNARSVARASFNIREKVRAETNIRTFDKMALEAEMYANIDKK